MSEYEPIEPQFDIAAQEARADAAKQAREDLPRADLGRLVRDLNQVADEIEKEALEAEKAGLGEVPEVPGKVEQEPEITPEVGSPSTEAEAWTAQAADFDDYRARNQVQGGG